MFNGGIIERLDIMRDRLAEEYLEHRRSYWELRGDIDRLVEALGMTKDYRVIHTYIKKGGPEQGGI